MEGSENRNSRRSIRLLKEAFLRLLAEKPFDQITVSDVTREADLNRGTFYAHYDNIEGLLRATMEDITERVSLLMDQSLSADFLDDPMPVLSRIGDYLGSDRALHEKIVSSTSVEPFINSLHEMFRKKIRERLRQDTSHPATKVDLVTIEYLASGVLGTYRSWLSGDFGDVPVESIDDYLCSLVRATGKVSFGQAGSQSAIAARRARA
jgi:AcrR family transcriptional regulator